MKTKALRVSCTRRVTQRGPMTKVPTHVPHWKSDEYVCLFTSPSSLVLQFRWWAPQSMRTRSIHSSPKTAWSHGGESALHALTRLANAISRRVEKVDFHLSRWMNRWARSS
eukprot:1381364-Prymnesium_polylepis.1